LYNNVELPPIEQNSRDAIQVGIANMCNNSNMIAAALRDA